MILEQFVEQEVGGEEQGVAGVEIEVGGWEWECE